MLSNEWERFDRGYDSVPIVAQDVEYWTIDGNGKICWQFGVKIEKRYGNPRTLGELADAMNGTISEIAFSRGINFPPFIVLYVVWGLIHGLMH